MAEPVAPSPLARTAAMQERLIKQRFPEFWESLPLEEKLSDFSTGGTNRLMYDVLNSLGGVPTSTLGQIYTDRFLDWMRDRTKANDASVQMSTYKQWEQEEDKYGKAARRLTPGGAANAQAEREYNLARAFVSDGEHAAPGSSVADMALSQIGNVTSSGMRPLNQARVMQADINALMPRLPFFSSPQLGNPAAMQERQKNRKLMGQAMEANYWWDQGEQKNPQAPVWADGMYGTKFPSKSPATAQGLVDTLTSTDTLTGAYENPVTAFAVGPASTYASWLAMQANPFREPEAYEIEKGWQDVVDSWNHMNDSNTVQYWGKRKTPVLPDAPWDAEAAREGIKAADEAEVFEQEQPFAHYPSAMEQLNLPRHYPSFAGSAGLTNIRDAVADPLTVLGILPKAFKGVRMLADVGEDMAFGGALTAAGTPPEITQAESALQGLKKAFVDQQPNPNVYVYDQQGNKKFVSAESPNYYKALKQGEADQRARYTGPIKKAAEAYRRSQK